jgi:hypothetical protein
MQDGGLLAWGANKGLSGSGCAARISSSSDGAQAVAAVYSCGGQSRVLVRGGGVNAVNKSVMRHDFGSSVKIRTSLTCPNCPCLKHPMT